MADVATVEPTVSVADLAAARVAGLDSTEDAIYATVRDAATGLDDPRTRARPAMRDGYTLFDTPLGWCGVAWSQAGLLAAVATLDRARLLNQNEVEIRA